MNILKIKSKDHFIYNTAVLLIMSFSISSSWNVSAPLGTRAILSCRVDGVPLDSSTVVVWTDPRGDTLSYNNNTLKTEDPRFSIVKPYHSEFNLHIRNIKMYDQGKYKCKAFKGEREFFNTEINLNILVPPTARTNHNTNISVVEGEQVVLECFGEGVPEPELDWKFHKKDTSVEETITMEDTSKYVIKNATLKQSGHYECQASNNVPPISSVHYYVNVFSKPKIHVPYMRVLQKVGHYIFLQCIVTWNPKGDFHWEHEIKKINDAHEIKKSEAGKYLHSMNKINDHTWVAGLFVFHFDISDGGRYRCYAGNKYGVINGSIEVAAYHSTGQEEPDMEERIHVIPGSDAILHCSDNDKRLPISWSKHTIAMKDFEIIQLTTSGVVGSFSKYQLNQDGSLKITSVNKLDQGYYICSNKSKSSIYLSVSELEASTSCDQNSVSLKTTLTVGAIIVFVLCSLSVVLMLVLRHRYRRNFNTSGESILTSSRAMTACKL